MSKVFSFQFQVFSFQFSAFSPEKLHPSIDGLLVFQDPRNGNGIEDSDHFGTENRKPITENRQPFPHTHTYLEH
ncbi:MAG: hypothetical protein AMS27_15505 [Bacteroides sp. SM23_62_1]|nr:MAG: hypothetical protein AMS27_15505 [Bacteroides sp. SM23_62_1]